MTLFNLLYPYIFIINFYVHVSQIIENSFGNCRVGFTFAKFSQIVDLNSEYGIRLFEIKTQKQNRVLNINKLFIDLCKKKFLMI